MNLKVSRSAKAKCEKIDNLKDVNYKYWILETWKEEYQNILSLIIRTIHDFYITR